jgi:hypothetical protein
MSPGDKHCPQALLCQASRDSRSDPARRTGNDGDAALERVLLIRWGGHWI